MTEELTSMNPKHLLQRELSIRCEKNPRYSLRAFSRALGMSHTALSFVLSGKRPLSKNAARKVSEVLQLDPLQRKALFENRVQKKKEDKVLSFNSISYHQISLDTFAVISDWYHYAILSLLDIKDSKFEAKWIAKKLGITHMEAQMAMDRLRNLGLVKNTRNKWSQSGGSLKVENTISTAASRKFHKQILNKAIYSLENDLSEARDFSAMTMAIDPKLVPYAKERIRVFRRELMQELTSKRSPKTVYHLAVQIYPVTKIEINNRN